MKPPIPRFMALPAARVAVAAALAPEKNIPTDEPVEFRVMSPLNRLPFDPQAGEILEVPLLVNSTSELKISGMILPRYRIPDPELVKVLVPLKTFPPNQASFPAPVLKQVRLPLNTV